ncbi:Gmad2 immunoglobulin-like domain-containing protein [Brevibacillus sp. H7]|uniref:Gmad2 immunoglobulin-like domain-containing protein n=1 Tax=Brevibacillus sp. H7 TaxID=3349138 RepID=UPI003820E606
MKATLLALATGSLLLLQACVPVNEQPPVTETPANPPVTEPQQPPATPPQPQQPQTPAPDTQTKPYENEIFQEVTVKKIKDGEYEVRGKARIFEAMVDYVVEDGHNELAKGSVMAEKGAPEWGNFQFTLQVKKAEPNSTLMLILFETSAKDGSRRMELPIPLPE